MVYRDMRQIRTRYHLEHSSPEADAGRRTLHSKTLNPNMSYITISVIELDTKDLVVSKILRQESYKYRNLFPHVSAALQLTETGMSLTRGDSIEYIYTDAAHPILFEG
jgi:DNA polymerase elongation subunit (family B)